MRRTCIVEGATKAFQRVLLTVLVFWVPAIGCNNVCVTGISNPPNGTLIVNVNSSACKLSRANGTVRLQLGASFVPNEGSGLPAVQHVFVSLRGVEAHPNSIADDGSPDWQELAPKLAEQPVQVDLMAQSPGSCEGSSFAEAVVPADAYRQVRLRLVPNQPAANDPVPEENACKSVGFNCIVTTDGGILLIVLDGEAPEIQIQSGRIAGGFLRILPETDVTVAIEFNPYTSLTRLAGEAVRLVPVFTVDTQAACASLANSDR